MKNIDVAFIPLNIPLGRMTPAAAADCVKAIAPTIVYPYHYDQARRRSLQNPRATSEGPGRRPDSRAEPAGVQGRAEGREGRGPRRELVPGGGPVSVPPPSADYTDYTDYTDYRIEQAEVRRCAAGRRLANACAGQRVRCNRPLSNS